MSSYSYESNRTKRDMLQDIRAATDSIVAYMTDIDSSLGDLSRDGDLEELATEVAQLAVAASELNAVISMCRLGLGTQSTVWPQHAYVLREGRSRFYGILDAGLQASGSRFCRFPGIEDAWPEAPPRASSPSIVLVPAEGNGPLSDSSIEAAEETKGAGIAELLRTLKNDDDAELALVEREAIVAAGRWVKGLREAKGMSQEELAEKAGTSAAQISILENGTGKRGASLGLLARVVHGLGWRLEFRPAT